ncbi:MAG: hypothetical protein Q9163_002697 [Psora crenata]
MSAGDLISIAQRVSDVHDTLAASYGRVDLKQVAITLESSKQKLELWWKTWLGRSNNPGATSEELWGKDGWVDIKKLLAEITVTIEQFNIVGQEGPKASPRASWRRFILFQPKYPRYEGNRTLPILKMALELDKAVDELWTYSELAFDSLHGILAQSLRPPVEDALLTQSIPVRQGALALYLACQKSKVRCYLDVDLFGKGRTPSVAFDKEISNPLTTYSSLRYRLFSQSQAELRESIIESFICPGQAVMEKAHLYNDPWLGDLKLGASSKSKIIGIQPKSFTSASYFRVSQMSSGTTCTSEGENLAQILEKGLTSTDRKTRESLSLTRKLELAFKLVECGFYLLGTPWLSSVGSNGLRNLETENQTNHFFLDVQAKKLDYLYFEDTTALSEWSQLFKLGVLLIEIALGSIDHADPLKHKEPYRWASKMLPPVEKAVGSRYYKACAFCIQDRRSFSSYGRPEKYQHAEKTGWGIYLQDFLREYHAQARRNMELCGIGLLTPSWRLDDYSAGLNLPQCAIVKRWLERKVGQV